MPTGVRSPQELAGLGLSQRLTVRVGALLKKNLALTLALLEGARPSSPLEAFLLDPRLLEAAERLQPETLVRLATTGTLPPLALTTAADGRQVLCLQEELDAGEWAVSPPAPATETAPLATTSRARLAVPERTLEREAREVLFARTDLDRLRLRLVTAANPEERVEALRTLVLAPLAPAEKCELLLQALSDRNAPVRAEAAMLLPGVGASPDIAETLASLNHAESSRRLAASKRLGALLSHAPKDLDTGAAMVCVLAVLQGEQDKALLPGLIELLRRCAPALSRSGARVADMARLLIEMLSAGARAGASATETNDIAGAVFRLFSTLGAEAPEIVLPILHAEQARCTDAVSASLLLQLLLELTPAGAPDEDALLKLAADFLSRDKEDGRESRAVGARLARRGDRAIAAIRVVFRESTGPAQRHFLMLLDELCRQGAVSATALESAGEIVLSAVSSGNRGLRLDAMQCRLAANPALSEDLRRRLATAFLGAIPDYVFNFDIEKAEALVARMGLAAVEPLLARLSAEYNAKDRIRAVRVLGALALNIRPAAGELPQIQTAITEVLRQMRTLSLEPDFPGRNELLGAIGKVAAQPAASKDGAEVVERMLLETARGDHAPAALHALDGLTYLAGSRRAHPELIASTCLLLHKLLEEADTEINAAPKQQGGEIIIEISGGEKYTTSLPLVLTGLSRIACAPNCPPPTLKETAHLLIARWREIAAGTLIWGPGNSQLLIQALKEVGCLRAVSPELRLDILRALAPKLSHTPVMHAMTEMLAKNDGSDSANVALSLGHALLERKGKSGRFAPEDREDILRALARLAARRFIGASPEKAATFRQIVVAELLGGLKDLVPSCYEKLVALRDNEQLPQELRDDIERRLREHHSLSASV